LASKVLQHHNVFLHQYMVVNKFKQRQISALCATALLCLLLAVAFPVRADTQAKSGCAVPIGGALKADNHEVWSRLVALSGGRGSRWLVIPAASASPEKSAAQVVESLQKQGAIAEMLPLSARIAGSDPAAVARDPVWIEKLAGAAGVYFTGGAQERITAALLDGAGKHTPLLNAIWQLKVRGGVVAGSSAGAAIMAQTMFREPPDNLTILRQGAKRGSEIDQGLGFAGADILVDQHFLKRGRIGRLLPVMMQERISLGVGVEENSAAIICGDTLEVIGARGVLIADMRDVLKNAKPSTGEVFRPFMAEGLVLTYIESGDRMHLRTAEVTLSAAKQAGNSLNHREANFKPYYTDKNAPRFYADMLGDNTIVTAMSALVDSTLSEVTGLAFSPTPTSSSAASQDKALNIGFTFRLYKRDDTRAWMSSASGGTDYSISRMGLDVKPVVMQSPLYSPYSLNHSGASPPAPSTTPAPAVKNKRK
jgi:cyanophycinase